MFYQKAANDTLDLRDIFSDVFKKHSREDGERMFASGTAATTPAPEAMLREWVKPWLFLRILAVGLLLLIPFYLMCSSVGTYRYGIIPFAVIASALMPIVILVFYWEMNIPRNIPIYSVLLMVMAGGILSLVVSWFLYTAFPITSTDPYYAGFVEEPAKLAAICIFLPCIKRRYILNGVLVGGSVGAGFALMETTKYFLDYGLNFTVLLQRGVTAPGGHVAWAAIYGGMLAYAVGDRKFQAKHLTNLSFLKYFGGAVLLHFLWDTRFSILPIPVFSDLKYILLIIAAWILLLFVIKKGIRQILTVTNPASSQAHSANTRFELCGVSGVYAGQSIPLSTGKIVMGRDQATCNLVFPSTAAGISRQQCVLFNDGQYVSICDSNSSNGTFVGSGERLTAGSRRSLRPGERFYLASPENAFELRIQNESDRI